MPLGRPATRTSTILKLDVGGLIVVFQHIVVSLHLVDSPQLHMTAFKLDGAAHFDRRIPPTDVGSATAHLSHGLRLPNTLNVGFGLRRNQVLQAPGMKIIVSQHGAFLPFSPLGERSCSLPDFSISVCLTQSKHFSHNFSFFSDNFFLLSDNGARTTSKVNAF